MGSRVIYLFGPSGCGKSTVGEHLGAALGGSALYLDGDDFHPPGNKEKMGAGIALQDEDRWPWFERIAAVAVEKSGTHRLLFVACSALKRAYRGRLRNLVEDVIGSGTVSFVWLDGSKELIASRIAERQHEYMPASLLDSQFAAFEEPAADEEVVRVSIDQEPGEIVGEIVERLALG
jgi:carbohydrate kinase (thermoresistant glucokinase family)